MKVASSIEINITRGDVTWSFTQAVEDEDLPSYNETAEALGRLSDGVSAYLLSIGANSPTPPPKPF